MTIKDIRQRLDQLKGERTKVRQNIRTLRQSIRTDTQSMHDHEHALEIVKEVGLRTQQQLQYHIGDITSLALEAVFDQPYELVAEFVQRRNKTECDLYFMRNDERVDPLTASGGGAVDVAAFALRVASWSMQTPRSRNVIILDEPLKYLSAEYREQASKMIKELSKKLNIQFIIVTHMQTLADYADKEFHVSIKNGVSKIR